MANYKSHGAEASATNTLTRCKNILTEDGACKRHIPQYLSVHQVAFIIFIACVVEHNLCRSLNICNDSLIALS